MLVPMGIINEFNEPTTFNGEERPNLSDSDQYNTLTGKDLVK